MSTHTLASVLARLKVLTSTHTDAELSRALSISPQTLSSWKMRDSIPYSLCVEIARKHDCSLDWLLLGEPGAQAPDGNDAAWEHELLAQLRALPVADRRAVTLVVRDKQRIQQLQQQLDALACRAGG
ncbi:helix-turn-helix domain containing protein [Pseudomonas xanthosomatis]|uniref:helix-turn-helix domain-containing protein n=1 Tax=Pseudomonas xanthosomatis TaxID=2842356 RepID=UPI001C3DD3CE|nr:helix-turn-helix domain-containing protein [Pseudomonas xanthosomatis]QXH45170.1 helix-turn-helix domain containing protein [Pseudomonas xanthosomatis]